MFKRLFSGNIQIPTLRLSGIISAQSGITGSGLAINNLEKLIEKLFSDKKSPAVALIINSPGGSPTQSSLIAKKIIELSKEKKKKVLAFVEDVAASGGYWLACAADEIYIDQNSVIGSIGVISPGFGFVELIKKIGIERRVYSQGKNKGLLDPFLPEKKDDVKQILTIQKDLHSQFIAWVKKRRGKRLKANDEVLFNAGVWSGSKAKELGLIDGIGDYYNVMKNIFGDDIKFKDFSKKTSWFKQKFLSNGSALNSDYLIESLIKNIEERIIWSKYGL